MLDAACRDTHRGGGPSIPPLATVLAAVTLAAALSEANTRPPSSVGVDVTATAVTTAADVANDARYDPKVKVDGSPSPAASLYNGADNGGAGNMLVQAAIMSVISIATKSSLRAYFEGKTGL
jgi:hypothetical protein